MVTYQEFLTRKSQLGGQSGFEPLWMPEFLFDFQKALVEWAIKKGRAAIFADCGLGKTPMQLVWAENVLRKTGRPVLIITPLAVSQQTISEGEKFGIEVKRVRDGTPAGGIVVTNYERLHYFNPDDFAGVVCDESSILKNFSGVRRRDVNEFMRKRPYRLLCTATAAPNDFTELGTSAEALGELGHMDMLARFFNNDEKTLFLHGTKYGDMTHKRWRFKAHSEKAFWRWVCSWARSCRKPSDLGYDDGQFQLPELVTREHRVKAASPAPGALFDVGSATLEERREEERRTIPERCEKVAELVNHNGTALVWCHLNEESRRLRELIVDCEEVRGSDSDERKEEVFSEFAHGNLRVLVTKAKIGGFGLNFQVCAHQTFFPSYSFEQWYQCIRRSWRYGQTNPVVVDIVASEGADEVLASLRRKAGESERMFSELVKSMHNAQAIGRGEYGERKMECPSWL